MRAMPAANQKPLTRPISKATFRAEVDSWAVRIGVQPVEVYIRPMKNKWGSCSTNGRVTFDSSLLAQDKSFRDRVIVEELLHLKVPDHRRLFKALLNSYLRS